MFKSRMESDSEDVSAVAAQRWGRVIGLCKCEPGPGLKRRCGRVCDNRLIDGMRYKVC